MSKLILVLLIGLTTPLAWAQGSKPSYDSFKLVKSRNIFDPNRRAVRREESREARPESRSRPNWLMLTGTMVTEGKTLAFFNSSRSDYRKVVAVGESIADYKVTAITPLQVEWERGGQRSVLAVGRQVSIEGTTTEPLESPAPEETAPPADGEKSAPATSEPAPSGDKNEVLRRMMERRAKEMNSK
jgi:hypothetical protein